ncbi:MAG: chromosome segregation protein SMC [Acetivibrio ethanolgignens]
MYLKSIEIQGFKSFAHKIVFEFHDGITAIVGPNGSGKSNVADAVRWVLGEQSAKQLRGSKMEDVIFSGTELRKPQGFAYVAITLDNSDHKLATSYEEVTVARRVYRSGESEYLMNGTNCRLKDVQELFLDTGIGKEGYSIIGQGQIDKILSGKPEERRELFDEAAGIVKFKKRKAAAEKNLEAERMNLSRVKDILAEIETQIAPLEKQSVVAKEYLRLRDELKTLDVNMFLMDYDRIHTTLEELNKKAEIVAGDLSETQKEYDSTKEEYERLERQMEEKNASLDEKRSLLSDSRLKKEQLESQIKVLTEQILATRQSSNQYKERVAATESSLETKEEELISYEKKLEEMNQGYLLLEEECQQEEEKLALLAEVITGNEQRTDELNQEIIRLLNESADVKARIQRFDTIFEQSNIKKAELTQKILKNKSDEAAFCEALEKEEAELSVIETKKEVLLSNNQEFEKDILALNQELSQIRQSEENCRQEYHREYSRLESLKNITERYEGYGQSIRRVMEQKEKNPGIIGVVADIIKVEKSYELAVETALGGSIQNIVTDSEVTAKQLIGFLKQNKYGRATFLPLTGIRGKAGLSNEQALKEKGAIGLASTLVNAGKEFSTLVDYLLGRVLVVDNIDNAIAIGRKYNQTIRMVTLEGDQINPGGSMSGGAYKNSSNLLGRRREMEELEKKIHKLQEKEKTLEADREKKREERKKLTEAIESNKAKLQELSISENTVRLKFEQLVQLKENNERLLEQIREDSYQIETQMKDLKSSMAELTASLEQKEEKKKEKEALIAALTKETEEKKEAELVQREAVSAKKLSYSTAEQNRRFAKENIERIQQEIHGLKEELSQLKEQMIQGESRAVSKEQDIENVRLGIKDFEEQILTLEKEITELITVKEEIEKGHKSFFAKREDISARMNELDKESFRLGNQKEKLSEQAETIMNYMWEEYELTYNSALALKQETDNTLSQMKKAISELKGRIKALGDVNVNAIEDFKNLSERYQLLKTQHDDLIQAEEVLVKVIGDLEEEMRKQFESKFQEIKTEFDKVFKELFGGGKGTLELQEDEDILEAGIRIIAQPPGKKLQNMMQLSGGEKALTAISLLFAIQNLKPSPFCLLDEIEAALDDSNVSRYAKYLHKLTKDTQFIVITHRRGTMAAADILYGITMQEKGVSTLVSVNLLEDELDK